MTDKSQRLKAVYTRFTSDMTTSATHELKNKLAIVNENAGLIQDLFYMAKQGRDLDITRIEAISHKIQDQVRLADIIIKKLNGFVQTMELSEEAVDLQQALQSVLALADRLMEKKGCSAEVLPPQAPVMVSADPFYLQNLLWVVINAACSLESCADAIRISFNEEAGRPSIWFDVKGAGETDGNSVLETENVKVLVETLGVETEVRKGKRGFGLLFKGI